MALKKSYTFLLLVYSLPQHITTPKNFTLLSALCKYSFFGCSVNPRFSFNHLAASVLKATNTSFLALITKSSAYLTYTKFSLSSPSSWLSVLPFVSFMDRFCAISFRALSHPMIHSSNKLIRKLANIWLVMFPIGIPCHLSQLNSDFSFGSSL